MRWGNCQGIYFGRSPYDLVARTAPDHVNLNLAGGGSEVLIEELSKESLSILENSVWLNTF